MNVIETILIFMGVCSSLVILFSVLMALVKLLFPFEEPADDPLDRLEARIDELVRYETTVNQITDLLVERGHIDLEDE